MDLYRISRLIIKKMRQVLTVEESKELDAWSKDNKQRESLLSDLSEENKIYSDLKLMQQFQHEKVWQQVQKEIGYKKPKELFLKPLLYAASILIIIGVLSLFAYYAITDNNSNNSDIAEVITPGNYNALLTIDDEERVLLRDTLLSTADNHLGTLANVEHGQLTFKSDTKQEPKEMILIVPIRSEYNFILSDGTQVWMNAGSKAIFKQPFENDRRDFYLEGEAYFKVAHDSRRPFIVDICGINQQEVLGTSFNIKAYPDQNYQQTVLVEGSVLWRNGAGLERIMEPGQLLEFNKEEQSVTVNGVDIDTYIAWKNGRFIFEGKSLESIMIDLSRWYGFKVSYQSSALKELHFSVDIRRYENLSTILEMLETTQKVKYEINGSEIEISEY